MFHLALLRVKSKRITQFFLSVYISYVMRLCSVAVIFFRLMIDVLISHSNVRERSFVLPSLHD